MPSKNRVPGAPRGGLVFGDVPEAPRANFPGGFATDLASGIGEFTEAQRKRQLEDEELAFRKTREELERDQFESENRSRSAELGIQEQTVDEEIRVGEIDRATSASEFTRQLEADVASDELSAATQRATAGTSAGIQAEQRETERLTDQLTGFAQSKLEDNQSPEEVVALLVERGVPQEDAELIVGNAQVSIADDARELEIENIRNPGVFASFGFDPRDPRSKLGPVPVQNDAVTFIDDGFEAGMDADEIMAFAEGEQKPEPFLEKMREEFDARGEVLRETTADTTAVRRASPPAGTSDGFSNLFQNESIGGGSVARTGLEAELRKLSGGTGTPLRGQ